MKYTLVCCLALAAPAIASDSHFELIERAFAAISSDFAESWAYTETALEEGIETVGRFDPRNSEAERWTLLLVDGRPPSDEEQLRFRDRKLGAGHGGDNDGARIVEPDSIELLEETPDTWVFAFKPAINDEDDKFMRHVVGRLTIDRAEHYVSSMALENRKPIRPVPGVKIKEFRTTLSFAPAAADGPVVPKSIDVRVKGGAFLAIRFDETESVRFSAWEFAGTE